MTRSSNPQQIQEFLTWLRNEKQYTIAHQFNRTEPRSEDLGQWALYNQKALKEIEYTDQQLLDEFFLGIKPLNTLPPDHHLNDPDFGSDLRKKWWQKIDGGICGCLAIIIVIIIVVSLYQCHTSP